MIVKSKNHSAQRAVLHTHGHAFLLPYCARACPCVLCILASPRVSHLEICAFSWFTLALCALRLLDDLSSTIRAGFTHYGTDYGM